MYLRHTAERVGILYIGRLETTTYEFAALQNVAHIRGTIDLAWVRTQLMNTCVKGGNRAMESLERKAAADISKIRELFGPRGFEKANSGHDRRTVGKSKTLFRREFYRFEAGRLKRRS